jgi:hypothetical protein
LVGLVLNDQTGRAAPDVQSILAGNALLPMVTP